MEPVSPQPSFWVTQAASDRLTQADNDRHSYNKDKLKLPAPGSFFNPCAYNSFSQGESEFIAFPPEDSSEESMCEEGTDSDEPKDLTLQIRDIHQWNRPETKTERDNRFYYWSLSNISRPIPTQLLQMDPPIFDNYLIPIDNAPSQPGDIAPPPSPGKEEDHCQIQ
jgi:hypothetical protein